MEKKYQVFVSSTYQDLIQERKEVIQALLELDCIPVGMEMFPATDDEQWKLIKELIDDCDYYILIVGGRYGSLNKDGISYTQMEYEYATEIGVPTIAFLPKNPESIQVSKTDKNAEKEEKLNSFKELTQNKLIKYWTSPEDLGSVVSRSLIKLIKTKPRTGWVKANEISSTEANIEILELRQKIQELESQIKKDKEINIKNLAQGNDIFKLQYAYSYRNEWKRSSIEISWNEIFSKTCAPLITEMKEETYKKHVSDYIDHIKEASQYDEVIIVHDNFLSLIIQFKALGLIEKSIKKRSVRDTSTYWKVTQKGDSLLTHLRAIRKNNEEDN